MMTTTTHTKAGALALAVAGPALGACSTGAPAPGAQDGGTGTAAQQSGANPAAAPDGGAQSEAEAGDGGGRILVAYFSAQNHTREAAHTIAGQVGADLFEIVPANPYSADDLNWNNPSSRVVAEHEDPCQRDTPLAATTPDGWADYDTVLVGYPIWWQDYAWPVARFAADNDFTGKTVIPFATSTSSPLGASASNLADLAGTGTWLEGQRFPQGAAAEISAWVCSLGL